MQSIQTSGEALPVHMPVERGPLMKKLCDLTCVYKQCMPKLILSKMDDLKEWQASFCSCAVIEFKHSNRYEPPESMQYSKLAKVALSSHNLCRCCLCIGITDTTICEWLWVTDIIIRIILRAVLDVSVYIAYYLLIEYHVYSMWFNISCVFA